MCLAHYLFPAFSYRHVLFSDCCWKTDFLDPPRYGVLFFLFDIYFFFEIYIFYIKVREQIVHALPRGEAHSLRRILFAWRVLWRMLWDHIQAAVESTLPWWRCQGVEALDNYEHFACHNFISHKQTVIVISHFLFSDIYAICFFFFFRVWTNPYFWPDALTQFSC